MKKFLIISFLLLVGFNGFGQVGCYSDCKKNCLEYTSLQLNTDSTFTMQLFCDVGGIKNLNGTWSSDADTISLTTEIHKLQSKYKLKVNNNPNQSYTKIEFKYKLLDKQVPMRFGTVTINDSTKIELSGNDFIKTDIKEITSIQYDNTIDIDVSTKGNTFEIILEDIFPPKTECNQSYYLWNRKYILIKKSLIPIECFLYSNQEHDHAKKLLKVKCNKN